MQGSAKENAVSCAFVYGKVVFRFDDPDGLLRFTGAMEFCATLRPTQRVIAMAANPLFHTPAAVPWSCQCHQW